MCKARKLNEPFGYLVSSLTRGQRHGVVHTSLGGSELHVQCMHKEELTMGTMYLQQLNLQCYVLCETQKSRCWADKISYYG